MASPIGHGLVGLAAVRLAPGGARRVPVWWYALAVLLANLPDFDFLPGILIHDAGRFHRGASHSLLAAGVVGVIAGLLARRARLAAWRFGAACAALYASHLVVDFFSEDPVAPVGQPLFWPLSLRVISPWTPFLGVSHDGTGLGDFIASVLTGANALVIGREVAVLAPILALAWLYGARRERRS